MAGISLNQYHVVTKVPFITTKHRNFFFFFNLLLNPLFAAHFLDHVCPPQFSQPALYVTCIVNNTIEETDKPFIITCADSLTSLQEPLL